MAIVLQQKPIEILHSVFGYSSFRDKQAEIIDHIINGQDALILMPTGGGKSLCYQIPALCLPGVAVIVSPLIALMQDQVESMKQLGIRASVLNSTLSSSESSKVEEKMRNGELDIVYVSPERLNTESFLDNIEQCELSLFAIDEAHCVSQWGHDFRPEYTEFSKLKERFPSIPRIALTATADELTRQDIVKHLGLENGRIFISSFDRPNINYRIMAKDNEKKQLLTFLNDEHKGDSGIVYCISRNKVMEVAKYLKEHGYNAWPYHAGLNKDKRTKNQDRFIKDEGIVMVATIAFGMGINKPDVRFVAHLDLPKSVESYYQETGRAGRDGLPSDAWMVYGIEDIVKLQQFIVRSNADKEHKMLEYQKLDALIGYVETVRCRRQVLLEYFGEKSEAKGCDNCDTCLEPVKTFDGTVAVQKALSCIFRTGQMFGITHIINILLGKEDEKVKRFNHNNLSTFGIGKEYDKSQWKSVFRQIIASGTAVVDMESYGAVKLSANSNKILRGEEKIYLRSDVMDRKSKKEKKVAAGKRSVLTNTEDEALFQKLKAFRLSLAQEQKIPPFIIFHDSTLIEMVNKKPENLEEFGCISGVGKNKLDRYGKSFLEIIKESN
ncbi:MAG: DNA helicase RecQ [Candidatus Gastranaerophilales bacterium]|nr:DNA helicase RecQ [Candidatus Gastranaerophilales bacterium]